VHDTDTHSSATTLGDMAEHISTARQRARRMLGGEVHPGETDDARQALIRARDGVLLVWMLWIVLTGFGIQEGAGAILVAAGVGFALLQGLSAGLATQARIEYYEAELQRERHEIQTTPEHERDEVRALYASKGFRPPLLEQIVDTLCADDDRLLKVMLEEELGLFLHHVNHPVLVGLWSGGGALAGALTLALPVVLLEPATARVWMWTGGLGLAALLAVLSGWGHGRAIPRLASWLIIGGVTGGAVHFLAHLLAGTA